MSPSNTAAWLTAKGAKPLEVKPAPYTGPGPGEVVIRNGAVAINPVDWMKQLMGDIMLGHIKYPFVLGCDVAGEVVEVGPGVDRLRVGDRVLANAVGGAPAANRAAEGAFQLYTVARQHLVSSIPDSISYEQACVVPLGLVTAAYGLFHRDFLGLDLPTVPARDNPTGRAVIVTGGCSSVGCNAVQLAAAAGYDVYTTCSAKNFAYAKRLGAKHVFDYHNAGWAAEMAEALRGQTVAGAYAIGDGSVEGCAEVLRRLGKERDHGGGEVNKFVAFAGFPTPAERRLRSAFGQAALVVSMVGWVAGTAIRSQIAGVKAKFIDQKDLCQDSENNVVVKVYRDFLPRALETKQFVPAPEPLVVGKGLDKIQEAFETHAKGVSARKVVVSL
ncbi:hypothetical protein VTK56DRAFT_1234 [Thermocarpiscus australiensis]